MDNQANKGIESDLPKQGRRRATRGRKPFVLESRFVPGPERPVSAFMWRMYNWHTWGRYHTQAARDEAYTSLVKKAESTSWSRQEYRKV